MRIPAAQLSLLVIVLLVVATESLAPNAIHVCSIFASAASTDSQQYAPDVQPQTYQTFLSLLRVENRAYNRARVNAGGRQSALTVQLAAAYNEISCQMPAKILNAAGVPVKIH